LVCPQEIHFSHAIVDMKMRERETGVNTIFHCLWFINLASFCLPSNTTSSTQLAKSLEALPSPTHIFLLTKTAKFSNTKTNSYLLWQELTITYIVLRKRELPRGVVVKN
jgi:hypothetical protein